MYGTNQLDAPSGSYTSYVFLKSIVSYLWQSYTPKSITFYLIRGQPTFLKFSLLNCCKKGGASNAAKLLS